MSTGTRREWQIVAAELRAKQVPLVKIARVLRERFGVGAMAAMRHAHGWSQNDAANEWCQLFPDTVKTYKDFSDWEVDRHTPPMPTLDKLARLYSCDLADLLADRPRYRPVDDTTGEETAAVTGEASDTSLPDPAAEPAGNTVPTNSPYGGVGAGASRVVGLSALPRTADSQKLEGEDVKRRQILQGSAALGMVTTVAPVVATSALLDAPPARVGEGEIAQVLETHKLLMGLSFTRGGGGIGLDDSTTQLRATARLLDARCSDRVRPDLCSAVGSLAVTVGFAAFDAGRMDDARRILHFALACAEEAGNWALRAETLAADLAPVELWAGRPDDALTLAEQAQVRSDRLTPVRWAMVWAARARAHAQLGDDQSTLSAIGQADEAFALVNPTDEPDTSWYTAAEHEAVTGQALGELVLTTGGQHHHLSEDAVSRQQAALAGFGDGYTRSKALVGIQLATLLMTSGDPAEAVGIAEGLLPDAEELESQRTRGLLGRLYDASEQHAGRGDVEELRRQLAGVG